MNIGLDPIRENTFFLNLAFPDLHSLPAEESVNYVVENDFETLGLKILKVAILHELFYRKQLFIGNIPSGHVKN